MDLQKSTLNQTEVSLSLAKHVIAGPNAKDSNIIFSPLSLHIALNMLAAGSNGPTRDQMLGFLKSTSVEELNTVSSHLVMTACCDGAPLGGPRLSIANGIWIDHSLSLKCSFKKTLDDEYKAVFDEVDFQTKLVEVVNEVNKWAEKETNGLIKEILDRDSVDPSTSLIFANALYFKGSWNQKFDESQTKDHNFFLLNGSSIQASFMTSKRRQSIRAFDGFKVLELPYKKGEDKREFSMCFYLPDAKDGLPALIEKMSSETGFIDHHRPHREVKVGDFRIPKFKIETGFEASEVLKGMGLLLPFSVGGLTEMVELNDIKILKIFQKSFIEVNEEGTEAAAVTVTTMTPQFLWIEDSIDFVADHPFAFVLREVTSGVVFFIGQVVKPSC